MWMEVWRALRGEPDPEVLTLTKTVVRLQKNNDRMVDEITRLRQAVDTHREGEIRAAQALENFPEDTNKVCTALWELSADQPSRCATLSVHGCMVTPAGRTGLISSECDRNAL